MVGSSHFCRTSVLALFMTSLIQTSGHIMAPVRVAFSAGWAEQGKLHFRNGLKRVDPLLFALFFWQNECAWFRHNIWHCSRRSRSRICMRVRARARSRMFVASEISQSWGPIFTIRGTRVCLAQVWLSYSVWMWFDLIEEFVTWAFQSNSFVTSVICADTVGALVSVTKCHRWQLWARVS